jgi:hypothetical protein
MKYPLIIRKIKFYCDWYNDLVKGKEHDGWLGRWVKERIGLYDEALEEWYKRNN